MCDKTPAEALKEELFYSPEHASYTCSDEEIRLADNFCIGYAEFLDRCKTEREAVDFTKALAEEKGFVPFDPTASYKSGDKVYYENRKKALILCVFGTESLAKGAKIVASHVDSPRLDLKPNPLYEDSELALLKTHYYGGIKNISGQQFPLRFTALSARKTAKQLKSASVRMTATPDSL